MVPSVSPSASPSMFPSAVPSISPSTSPSELPSVAPSTLPSASPSSLPSPTPSYSSIPSILPSESLMPSLPPSESLVPSAAPTTPECEEEGIYPQLVDNVGPWNSTYPHDHPITILNVEPGENITFKVCETFLVDVTDYLAIEYECVNDTKCDRYLDVSEKTCYPDIVVDCYHDPDANSSYANVSLYIQDLSIDTSSKAVFPYECSPIVSVPEEARRYAYHFRMPCENRCHEPPTEKPTIMKSQAPSTVPTALGFPSAVPTVQPSEVPSIQPTESAEPSITPTISIFPSASSHPPTTSNECPDLGIVAEEVGHEGTLGELAEIPIEIIGVDPNAYVAFRIKQTIIPASADYLSIMYECLCVRFQDASFEDYYPELIGECKDGEATVSLYLQDVSLPDGNNVPIPSMCNPFDTDPPNTKRVAYHFRLPCDTLCVEHEDQLSQAPAAPTAPTPAAPTAPTPAPTFASTLEGQCDKAIVVGYEDFESGSHGSWNNGMVSNDPALSWFLGRIGKENNRANRVYIVPPQAASATIEFTMYEIDEWEIDDKFTIVINSRQVDLGQFYATDLVSNPFNYESGSKAGILWLRYSITPAMKVAFNSTYADQAHKVELRIPPSYYADGTLEVEVKLSMNDVIENESAGIDNIKVTAHGLCHSTNSSSVARSESSSNGHDGGSNRLLDEKDTKMELVRLNNIASDEPDWDNEEGGAYCSSEDYPCTGDKTVYICHYNPHLGYQTFCVPEEESDIVKFYVNSYCGACVGGFGGKWH